MSKSVSFVGDKRLGDWAVENLRATATGFAFPMVASYVASQIVWAPGQMLAWMPDGWDAFDGTSPNASAIIPDRQVRCSDGHVRDAASANCTPCAAGFHANEALWLSTTDPYRESCATCPVGKFAAGTATTDCSFCPADYEARAPGSTVCTKCASKFSANGTGGLCEPLPPDRTATLVLMVTGGTLGVLLFAYVMRRIVKLYYAHERQMAENADKIMRQCEEASEAINTYQAPLMLMSALSFLSLESMRPHEEVRDAGLILVIDTMDKLSAFAKTKITVFFSHQWLSYSHPDPEQVQFKHMAQAVQLIAKRENRSLEDVYIWADWMCIPQQCRAVQRLAINSLPALASSLQYFVVVAPDAKHADTCVPCNRATYHKRTWCRAEMMSHWSRCGSKSMFYCDSDGLQPMAPNGVTPEFISSIQVFNGELTCCQLGHNDGTVPCDRQELVLPMLGLYAEIYRLRAEDESRKTIFEAIEPSLHEIYPPAFEYTSPKHASVAKPLFGDLITAARRIADNSGSDDDSLSRSQATLRGLSPGTNKSVEQPGSKHGHTHASSKRPAGSGHASGNHSQISVDVQQPVPETVSQTQLFTKDNALAV